MKQRRVLLYVKNWRHYGDTEAAHKLASILKLPRMPIIAREDNILNCLTGARGVVVLMPIYTIPTMGVRGLIALSSAIVVMYDNNYNFCTKDGKELSVDELIELINSPS